MTNAQIAEHYSNCLKLSAENKINLKNAFDLHLIDYMSSILNHGEANFQTASSTIDASAKIYAYRVDSLYKETYKIYGGLGRSDKASPQEDGEAVDPGDEIIANKAPATPVAKKKKKKITRGSCIETNEKALNSVCNEAKLQTDELFESVRSSFEEGNTSGLFLNTLPTLSDNNRLVLHSFCEISTAVNENSVDENILERACNSPIKNLNDESFQVDSSFDVLSSCRTNGEPFVAKDIEPIDLEHANPDADTTIVAATYSENQQNFDLDPRDATILNESVDFDDEEDKPDFSEAKFAAGDSAKFKALEAALSTKDLDYSYFDPTLLQTWMGPNHWKLKRNVAKNEKDSAADLDNEEADKDKTKSKQQRGKRKQLTDSRINFNEKVDFKKILKTVSKSSTVLSATILSKYKSQDLLFEPDVDLQNPYNFNNLMLKPMIKI
uniref:Condensin complex subunit 2 n=1 Tax=Romanomermis culicivorax TaxID=13658 RepID=A0A915JAX3_ROMCU